MPKKPVKKIAKAAPGRNIGLGISTPTIDCKDKSCPFHGNLPVRGLTFEGLVVADKMDKTVVVKREHMKYVEKYERFQKRTSRIPVHNPPCIDAKVGERVSVVECRPLSKTVTFVAVQRIGGDSK